MDSRILILPLALVLVARSAPPLPVPGRDGSAAGALRKAQEEGRFDVPWTVSAELDGQAEEWVPWAGLPLREKVVSAGGGEDDLSGSAGGAGPLGAGPVAGAVHAGFGGLDEREILPHPLAQDTPVTAVQFWRGAVNSYRFGMGLSRNLIGPWNLDLRANARSAPGRFWEYRQQVNDMYGPRGKPQGLPYQGRGPGQDDVRWEFAGSRSLPGGRLDVGWNWVDAQRGVPDPLSTWDSVLLQREAFTSRSGLFARLQVEREGWEVFATGRSDAREWQLPAWSDTGGWKDARGAVDVRGGSGRIGFGPLGARAYLEGSWEDMDGSAMVPRFDTAFDGAVREIRARVGGSASARWGAIRVRGGGGWSRLEPFEGRELSGLDASAELRLGTDSVHASTRWSRSVVLPGFAELMRPDVFRPRLDASGLGAETRQRAEARLRWAARGFSAELGGAFLAIQGAIRPQVLPYAGAPDAVERSLALRPVNRDETVLGFSTDAGVHASWRWFEGSSRVGFGRAGLPGEPLGGVADLSEPQVRTRSTVGWSAELLPGRFLASTALGLNTWSESWIYVPGGAGSSEAVLLDLPASWGLDFEARCVIRTFEIFWRLENLGDKKQYVLPGWTPLGVRAGWGVVWSFGG